MSDGNLILSDGTALTPEDIRLIAAEAKKILASESKELMQYEEVTSLSGISSFPAILQQGVALKFVRVAMDLLKGLDGKNLELTSTPDAIQWRVEGDTSWRNLVALSSLKGGKGDKGDDGPPPVLRIGNVETKLPDTVAEASVVENGYTENGAPIYELNFKIPAGKPGQDGNGAGNVYVKTDNIQSGHNYVFKAGADNSANGTFVEIGDIELGVGRTYPDTVNGEIFNDYKNNIAFGKCAHAEGQETNATGPRAHAEGYLTKVFAADAHAEGRETWCLAAQGHAEGFYSISYGANSHVEGCAYGGYPYAPLTKTILATKDEEFIRTLYANTDYFLTYLDKTLVINGKFYEDFIFHGSFGERNHVEGVNNSVLCNTSHVEGFNNTVGNSITRHGANSVHHAAHVEGCYNEFVESGAQSSIHIEGSYNSIIETSSTIINEDGSIYVTYYDATGSHVEGCHNVITAYDKSNDSRQKAIASHVGGSNCTITKASYAFAHGYGLSITNDYEASFGKYNLSYINGKKIIFSVGIGSSDEKRENAISIFEDGSVSIPKLEGGSISEQIDNAFNPLSNKLNNYYNELNKRLENLENAIKDITSVISMLHPELKVYVIGDKIIMTNLIDAIVSNDLLEINDTETKVIDDTLVFGEIPQTGKAFVKSSTLYFTSEAEVSVLDDTLITKDNGIYIDNNILTII